MAEKRKSCEVSSDSAGNGVKRAEHSSLDALKKHSVVVADTGDFQQLAALMPQDGTTNPTLLLQASQLPAYRKLLDDAIAYGRSAKPKAEQSELVDLICDKLAVSFGCEILKIIPGVVSTEVNACLSFDKEGSVAKARHLIKLYEEAGVSKERILIKLASTWEGCEAAKELEKEGIHCNMTLLFCMAQAVAAAQAQATLVSPFVGRILDWYNKNHPSKDEGYKGDNDPGVKSVKAIYKYYKKHGHATLVMGASFRNVGEILSLCGCDKLTVSPKLLEELLKMSEDMPCVMSPEMDNASDVPNKMIVTEKMYRWMLNEDRMASDLLSDGIRRFNADLEQLKVYIAKETAAAK